MKKSLFFVIILLLLTNICYANPSSGPIHREAVPFSMWLLETLPLNFFVDLLAFFIAIYITGNISTIPKYVVCLYNIVVCFFGYMADFGAKYIVGIHVVNRFGEFIHYNWPVVLLFAALLIFIFNFILIRFLLKSYNVSTNKLPIAAAIMAILTAPYVDLVEPREMHFWFIPLLTMAVMLILIYRNDIYKTIKHK